MTVRRAKGDKHIHRPLLLQNLPRIARLIIKRHVDAEILEELDFIFRAGGGDDFEALVFCELDDDAGWDGS